MTFPWSFIYTVPFHFHPFCLLSFLLFLPYPSILSTYVANSWTVKHVKKSGPRRISIEDPALTQSYPHALSVLKAWQLSQFLSSDLHLPSETFFSLSLITKPYLTKSQNFQSNGRLNLSKVSNKQQVDHEKNQPSIFIKCSDYGDLPVLTQNTSRVSVYLICATVSWDWWSRWRDRFWGNTVTYQTYPKKWCKNVYSMKWRPFRQTTTKS